MASATDSLESFWEDMLSGEPERIRRAWRRLSPEEAAAALAHLRKMAHDAGWQPAQQQAATEALKALGISDF